MGVSERGVGVGNIRRGVEPGEVDLRQNDVENAIALKFVAIYVTGIFEKRNDVNVNGSVVRNSAAIEAMF